VVARRRSAGRRNLRLGPAGAGPVATLPWTPLRASFCRSALSHTCRTHSGERLDSLPSWSEAVTAYV